VKRPCLNCGALTEHGSRCNDCKPKNHRYQRGKVGRTASDWRWRKLSAHVRKASPFCEWCSATTDLTTDKIIPLTERPDLAREVLNVRVLCRRCNSARSDRVTDRERRQVLDSIAARTARTSRRE